MTPEKRRVTLRSCRIIQPGRHCHPCSQPHTRTTRTVTPTTSVVMSPLTTIPRPPVFFEEEEEEQAFMSKRRGVPRGRLLLAEKGSLVNDSKITGGSAQNSNQGGDEDADVGILSHQGRVERVLAFVYGERSCVGNNACEFAGDSGGTTTIGDDSC
jgi:hypothetical protein